MKLTKETLKQIIKEELEAVMTEEYTFSKNVTQAMSIVWDEEKYPNIPKKIGKLAEYEEIALLQSALEELDNNSKNNTRIQTDLDTWQGDAISFMTGEDTRGIYEGDVK